MKRYGFKGQFLVVCLILVVVGSVSTSLTSYIIAQRMMKRNITEQLNHNRDTTIDYIQSWIEGRKGDMMLWSVSSSITNGLYYAGSSGDGAGSAIFVQEILDELKKINGANPFYELIGVADINGLVISTSRTEAVSENLRTGKSITETDFFQQAAGGKTYMSNVLVSPETGKAVFVLSAPIKNASLEGTPVIGILYGMVDMEAFAADVIRQIKIGQNGYICIFDRSGMIISHPDTTLMMRQSLKNTLWGAEILAQPDGLISYEYNGNSRIASYRQFGEQGWIVAAVIDAIEAKRPVWLLANYNIIVTLIILVLASIIVFILSALATKPIQKITSSLSMIADQFTSASRQVAQSSQQVAQGASAQAASVEETSASLEELASMAKQNADNAQSANALSVQTSDGLKKSAESIGRLMQAMESINQSGNEVAKVAKAIEEIAFQTNLLALNAAVEAARAGDAGRGFAVVADEVRNLAQRASEQARTTSDLISASSDRIKDGTRQAEESNQSIQSILRDVQKVVVLVNEISASNREQARGISQMSQAMSNIDHIVQQNSANSEESASSSQQLLAQAGEMKTYIKNLEIAVIGTKQLTDAPPSLTAQDNSLEYAQPEIMPKASLQAPALSTVHYKPAKDLIPFDDDDELKDF
jgi:methyl-accepting chemotaxis protein